MTYKTTCSDIKVEINFILENDVYFVPYKFPLLIYRENSDIENSTINYLHLSDIKSITVSEYPEDILINLEKVKDKELLLSKYLSYENTIDNIRRPWVSMKIVELSRELGKDFVEMAKKYSEDYSESLSFLSMLATNYRMFGDNLQSYECCLKILERKGLFWERDEYKKCMNELSIVGFYVNDKKIGMMGSEYNCLSGTNHENLEHLMRNRLFYVKDDPMPILSSQKYQINVRKTPGGDDFRAMNPNTIQYNGKIFGAIRTVNYYKYGIRFFYLKGFEQIDKVFNYNYLIEYDSDYNITSQKEFTWTAPLEKGPTRFHGFEDIRLINDHLCIATICELKGRESLPTQCLCHFNINTAEITKIAPMIGNDPLRIEKNWLPFYDNNKLYIIYNYYPYITIYQVDENTGEKLEIIQKKSPLNFNTFRGSAPPIPYSYKNENGYLFGVHEVVHTSCYDYSNRLVWMDKDFNIKYISPLFIFDRTHEIEFLTSIQACHDKISFWIGINDNQCWRYDVSKEIIDKKIDWIKIEDRKSFINQMLVL